MDALVRRRRALLISAASAALIGSTPWLVASCAGARDGHEVGVSHRSLGGSGARDGGGDAPFVDGAGSLPGAYRTTFAKVNKARFVSQGHASGRWEVDVWANEAAQKALASRSREVPAGAVVVEEHFERTEGKPPGPIMVMEKKSAGFSKEHGDWRWAVVGSQGQLVKDGVIEPCAGCHDDAPMDGLFPIVE